MHPDVTRCPACGHQVRVADDLLGKPVRCVHCRVHFLAPTRNADGALGEPHAVPTPKVRLSSRPTFLAGLGLLLVGLVAVLVNARWVVLIVADPAGYAEVNRQFFKQAGQVLDVPDDPNRIDELGAGAKKWYYVFLGAGVVTVAGAACMLAMRFYPVAVAGCVLSMVNVSNFCCMIGFPAGFWALIKLLDPDTRVLFRRGRV